jgi:hypothetical protein
MVIEGGATEKLGVATPLVLGLAASLGIETELSCLGTGLTAIGGAGVMRAVGLTVVVWGMGTAAGTLGRVVGDVPGTVTVGLLRLGDGTLEPTGGREDNVSGEDKGGVGTPSVGTGEL